jgi:hypothetical protein
MASNNDHYIQSRNSIVKKLRKKFVLTAMLSLLLILFIMIAVINLVNVNRLVFDADNMLNMLATNDGEFPIMPLILEINEAEEEIKQEQEKFGPREFPMAEPNSFFAIDRLTDNRSREMPYQTRYFYVKYDAEGNVTEVNAQHVAAVSETKVESYANAVYSDKDRNGFFRSYRYKQHTKEDGSRIIVFTDISASLLSAYTLLSQSLLIGFIALIAMFILVYLFSGKAVAPVVESLDKQKRFITDAGHELKTPLAVISANIDVLEIESGKSEWTTSIRNQIKRMNSLVKNMLTLSRMDEDIMHVVYSDFDMSAAVKETAKSFETVAESKNKTYETSIADDIHITGDKNSITQLSSLLLDNAMKYSSDKGDIKVSLVKEKNIVLEVSNECSTMPEGNLDKLFDRFYRSDSSRSRETGGFGIGLSVARAIATAHGGTIEALRDGDNRIRFVVTLPKQLPKNLISKRINL